MFIAVHVAGRVLRCIDGTDRANALSKAKLAASCTPGAGFEELTGEFPEDMEAFASEYLEKYLDKLATRFLEENLPDETTKVQRPSGLRPKVRLVSENEES